MISHCKEMGTRTIPWFVLPAILFISFSFNTYHTVAVDSIYQGQSLTGNQTITSQGGRFVLGFFSPGNSQNYYIGIWQNKISESKVVWVANRETPLPNTSSMLKISEDGNLLIINPSKLAIWSTNLTSIVSNYAVAVLLDTGNLVLKNGSNSSDVIWHSFDHPTDTWMPGGRIGLNKITGEVWRLTSWRNSEDPAPGPFSFGLEINGTTEFSSHGNIEFSSWWNGSRQYWSSEDWIGQFLALVPDSKINTRSRIRDTINYTLVSNENESYFTYLVEDSSLFVRKVINFSTGKVEASAWMDNIHQWALSFSLPVDQCQVYSLCGAFGICNAKSFPFCTCLEGFEPGSLEDWNLGSWSGGCVRKTRLKCQNNSNDNEEKDGFLMISNILLPENNFSLLLRSIEECKLACLMNCSCTAYAYGSSCQMWIGDILNLQQLTDDAGRGGRDLYIRLSASDLPKSSSSKPKVIGVTIGSVTAVVAVLSTILVLIMRMKKSIAAPKKFSGSLVQFSYRELRNSTKNFSEKLGEGSFGSVFKGTLPDSTFIAVKKLEGLRQGEKHFGTEVSTIGKIQHVNLIRLRGFCSEGRKRLLVYEFMPNGSLDFHLFRKNSKVLDWKTRYGIALGTAKGLYYLHEKCRDYIIHCDIKPANILLDSEFCPKVADFGMAKLLGREFSKVLTTMRGTIGYLAPEWISGLPITPKADVYSYGMMLFEVISGRRNANQSYIGAVVYFPIWAACKLHEGELLGILDSRLEGDADMDELERACRVACWCIQELETSRPSMEQVVQMLEGNLQVNMPPIPRHLQCFEGSIESLVLCSDDVSTSAEDDGEFSNSSHILK